VASSREFAVLVAAAALGLAGCRPPIPSAEREWRAARGVSIRQALPPAERASFAGLAFFPYDPDYRIRAMMEPVTPPEELRLAASDGSVRPALKVGRLHLHFPAGEAVLSVYQLQDIQAQYPDHLFLPFRDANAGKTTYGAGRYVEVERLAGGVLQVDFNRAYNPDCAYGISGQCPVTPAENTLPFAVPAGEKLPPGHH
jgi:uncharacterized protein (DUF1684 family)